MFGERSSHGLIGVVSANSISKRSVSHEFRLTRSSCVSFTALASSTAASGAMVVYWLVGDTPEIC